MYNRRAFLKNLGAMAALISMPMKAALADNIRVIVVGGGVAGTRAAAYLKMSLPSASITLFDPALKSQGNERNYSAIEQNYKPVAKRLLAATGVDIITDQVVQIDPAEKTVLLANGKKHRADFLVVAPGVDFKWHDFDGYDPTMEKLVMHGWQHPNAEIALWRQIESMRDGDSVVISVPAAPYRFPQGPYQRATKIADYLKTCKTRSKLLVLDGNDSFPGMQRTLEQWAVKFPDRRLEWVAAAKGGVIDKIDIQNNTVITANETISAGVLNLIPAQQAGFVARQGGLAVECDWCQVSAQTLESSHYKNVYVLGDANDADSYNKTAAVAEQHAVRCVTSIKALLA